MTLQITRPVNATETVELKVPSFWKDKTNSRCLLAILDDQTVTYLFSTEEYTSIANGTPANMQSYLRGISNYTEISEHEFFCEYDDAWESLRLRPQLSDSYIDNLKSIGLNPKEKTY